jgi:ferredoxin-type protein NapG
MCVRDCPYNILELARPESPIATGTPYFTARSGPCEMCEDIPCVKACPTGALDHRLTDINQSRMGLAVLSDQETCLNFLGLRCDVCYRVCPVIDKAITLELRPNTRTGRHTMFIPTVHSEHCTGCGKCENACVTEEASIKVLPGQTGQGLARRALPPRLGREEGPAAIRWSKTRIIVDLPDRMPDGMKLEGHFDPGSDKCRRECRGAARPTSFPACRPGSGAARQGCECRGRQRAPAPPR